MFIPHGTSPHVRPREGGTALYLLCGAPSYDLVEMTSMQSIPRPNAPYIFPVESISHINILNHKKRSPKQLAIWLFRHHFVTHTPRAFSVFCTACTISANSSDSREKSLSGPSSSRESVRCLSTIRPPVIRRPQGLRFRACDRKGPAPRRRVSAR